jgi:hypothetical protein
MMRLPHNTPVPLRNKKSKGKQASLPLARCARVPRATARLKARSSWAGGLFHPPLPIPPAEGLRHLNPAGRAFVPSLDPPDRGDFRSPLDPIDQGPCPSDPREARAALTHPAQPSAGWIRARLDARSAIARRAGRRKRHGRQMPPTPALPNPCRPDGLPGDRSERSNRGFLK